MTDPRHGLTFAEFWRAFVRVPDASGALVVPVPHREQRRLIEALDLRDERGWRRFQECLLCWGKKTAKSFMGGAAAVYFLVSDPLERADRLIGIAASDEEQSDIVFTQARQIVERHPYLREHVTVYRGELVYLEAVTDPRTGGTYRREHRLRKLARDTSGLHGEPWSHVIRDELWAETDHAMTEALIPSPNRASPVTLYLSYAPLKSNMKPGAPLYDLLQRVERGDPTLFHSFIGGTGDDASWRICPWITEDWIEAQRRVFAASPSRFRRVVLNEITSGDGDTLLTTEEIRDAIDPTLPAAFPVPGAELQIGLDLGATNDHAALTAVHVGPDGRVVVDVVKIWRGTRDAPVSFMAIEDYIVNLSRASSRVAQVCVDAWSAHLLTERLKRRGVPVKAIAVGQTKLDEIVTVLKGAFSRRAIRLRPTEAYLLEQLESLKTVEARGRRDMVKFAPSGTGPDASQHDDAAVALGLILTDLQKRIGKPQMAEMDAGCPVEQYFQSSRGPYSVDCYLWGGHSLPVHAPCRECPGHVSTLAARAAHQERTGQMIGLREFVQFEYIKPNNYVINRKFDQRMSEWP